MEKPRRVEQAQTVLADQCVIRDIFAWDRLDGLLVRRVRIQLKIIAKCLSIGWGVVLVANCGCTPDATKSEAERPSAQPTNRSATSENWAQIVQSVLSGTTTVVQLSETPIDGNNLRDIANLKTLETLILDAGSISDDDMTVVGSLPSLTHLRVRESRLTDAGIEKLASGQLSQLRILNLPQAVITVEGLRKLTKFPELRQLRLGGRQLKDQEMAEIAKLPKLESLHLIGPKFTDRALEYVAEMSELNSFYLDDCALSDVAWKKLFTAKPNLHVHIDQHHHDRDPAQHPH